jgi:hypothetical protein
LAAVDVGDIAALNALLVFRPVACHTMIRDAGDLPAGLQANKTVLHSKGVPQRGLECWPYNDEGHVRIRAVLLEGCNQCRAWH